MDGRESSFTRASDVPTRWLLLWRIWYWARAAWRHLRVTYPMTWLLGPQYRRSRDLIEIDITYACNLHCLNCNRSVSQAPEAMHMPRGMVEQFVRQSIERGRRWRRIRVLGGEPTAHPEFREIIADLLRYRDWNPSCIIEVVTNGYGESTIAKLDALPKTIWVENSSKTSVVQPTFGPFNLAPVDDPKYALADYTNGCAIMSECGMGLTPLGYYPCAVAGGIDRIVRERLGADELPADGDDMEEAARRLCRLCGRFRAGHFIPRNLRPPLLTQKTSPTWSRIYEEWRRSRRGDGSVRPPQNIAGETPGTGQEGTDA